MAFAPALIAVQCWLSVGLFIVAHDCMHGSFLPGRPLVNRVVGQLCLGLYAGFSFAKFRAKHFEHHAHPGTEHDPDFHAGSPRNPVPWFAHFFSSYVGWREAAAILSIVAFILLVLHASLLRLVLFWGLPALLSAVQLFYFGTFLPHRQDKTFEIARPARSSDFSWIVSLLTCFHFGYHLEHHQHPGVPWWLLPALRRQSRSSLLLAPAATSVRI